MWHILPLCCAVIPLLNAYLFSQVPMMPATPEEQRTKLKDLFRSKAFIIAVLMMVSAGSSELTMAQWSSLFAEQALGVSKVMGDLLGPCLFALCMATVRMLYGMYGERIDLNRALIASATLAIICYATAVFSTIPMLSLVGCALCGVSVALMWPGSVSATAKLFPLGGTAMFGVLAIAGDTGCSIGPWLAGAISDAVQTTAWGANLIAQVGLSPEQLGLKAGLLVAIVFPVMLLVCTLGRARQGRG